MWGQSIFLLAFPTIVTSTLSWELVKQTIERSIIEIFNCSQAGRDVVACLNEAMERQGLNMRVSALVGFSN